MFERFTHDARQVVTAAQELARETDSPKIDSRHVLGGLATHGEVTSALRSAGVDNKALAERIRSELSSDGLDAEALATLGIDLESVSARADELFGQGALRRGGRKRARGHVPFTSDAKKILELALREAIRLKHRTIDGRHVLLGLIRAECPGRATLTATGADLEELRTHLEQPEAKSA